MQKPLQVSIFLNIVLAIVAFYFHQEKNISDSIIAHEEKELSFQRERCVALFNENFEDRGMLGALFDSIDAKHDLSFQSMTNEDERMDNKISQTRFWIATTVNTLSFVKRYFGYQVVRIEGILNSKNIEDLRSLDGNIPSREQIEKDSKEEDAFRSRFHRANDKTFRDILHHYGED